MLSALRINECVRSCLAVFNSFDSFFSLHLLIWFPRKLALLSFETKEVFWICNFFCSSCSFLASNRWDSSISSCDFCISNIFLSVFQLNVTWVLSTDVVWSLFSASSAAKLGELNICPSLLHSDAIKELLQLELPCSSVIFLEIQLIFTLFRTGRIKIAFWENLNNWSWYKFRNIW